LCPVNVKLSQFFKLSVSTNARPLFVSCCSLGYWLSKGFPYNGFPFSSTELIPYALKLFPIHGMSFKQTVSVLYIFCWSAGRQTASCPLRACQYLASEVFRFFSCHLRDAQSYCCSTNTCIHYSNYLPFQQNMFNNRGNHSLDFQHLKWHSDCL
jgi:hypothetical protein